MLASIEFDILEARTYAVSDHYVHRASDLARDERVIIERWLGRALYNDETISVNAYRPHGSPTGDERDTLRRDVVTQAREIGSRAPDAHEEEVETLLDEALAAVRGERG